jgi:pimeloyl-ACP methyl ester carboxylesterase
MRSDQRAHDTLGDVRARSLEKGRDAPGIAPEREYLGELVVEAGSAAGPAPRKAADQQHPVVAEIDDLLERVSDLAPLGIPPAVEAHTRLATTNRRVESYEVLRNIQLDFRVVERERRFDISAVQGLERQLRDATDERLSQPRPRRQTQDRSLRSSFATFERAAASPALAKRMIQAARTIDVRGVLGAVRVPTLVLHHAEDIVPLGRCR